MVAATGRFQSPIHAGHLQYLAAARKIAKERDAPFIILTGPYDDELLEHEHLRFEQRRAMLNAATGVSEGFILNHGGSPRGGPAAVVQWAAGFFAPIRSVNSLPMPAVELVVVRKRDDIKDYGFGRDCHYSDLLKEFVTGVSLCIRDLTADMSHLELSTRHLRAAAKR
jgi:hypothetical protein